MQNRVAIKLLANGDGDVSEVLDQIKAKLQKIFPDAPFGYWFFEDEIKELYQKEADMAVLLNGVMFITILISAMGVFGLAMFNAEVRTREIGIRKVLGAKVSGIIILFTREFMILASFALVVASPIGWYFANEWLSGYAYRIDVHWTVFFFAGLMVAITALIAGGSQALKAAVANPVKSLRSE
jgi:putative ABC transport system permease protein